MTSECWKDQIRCYRAYAQGEKAGVVETQLGSGLSGRPAPLGDENAKYEDRRDKEIKTEKRHQLPWLASQAVRGDHECVRNKWRKYTEERKDQADSDNQWQRSHWPRTLVVREYRREAKERGRH